MLRVREESLDWALAHVTRYGDTDVFPEAFEYRAIRHSWDAVREHLASQNVLKWKTRPHRSLLAPKQRVGFRVITQLDPLDMIVQLALLYEMGQEIEEERIDPTVVHSYRFSPNSDGQMFDPQTGYDTFQAAVGNMSSRHTYVAVTDIADFYLRIYHHRLQNALEASTNKTNHVIALTRMLSGLNESETFGIPVGNSASRLLSEATISDVDHSLLGQGIPFVRFTDDYRIFADSPAEAYRKIAFLADTLYRNHGLTLQPKKTVILSREEFESRYLPDERDREMDSLAATFDDIVEALGLESPYDPIDYDGLDEEQQRLVDSLNLSTLLEQQLETDEPDLGLTRFVLRRLGQLGDASVVDSILDRIDAVYPVFPDIIRYLKNLGDLDGEQRTIIGRRVLDMLADSIVSELPFHKMWGLDLFATSTKWDQGLRLQRVVSEVTDQFSLRKWVLGMGRAGHRHWFQGNWRRLHDQAPWCKRALLAGASCMSTDARRHWYKAVNPRLDVLEVAVAKWAQDNPFGQ